MRTPRSQNDTIRAATVPASQDDQQLSLQSCRRLLENGAQISVAELLALRDHLYRIAEFSVSLLPHPNERESIEERAAILEFDAGIPKRDAELDALLPHLRRKG